MTRRSVTDEQYGKLQRKVTELVRRVDEGALDYYAHMKIIQAAIEGGIVPLLQAGGVVMQGPVSVSVQYPGFEKFCSENAQDLRLRSHQTTMQEWAAILPEDGRSYSLQMYFAHFEFFGEQQPSTEKSLEFFKIKGYRAATPCELYYAVKKHSATIHRFGMDIIACGVDVNRSRHTLVLDTQRGGTYSFGMHNLMQPWWPYCTRFALVKEKGASTSCTS